MYCLRKFFPCNKSTIRNFTWYLSFYQETTYEPEGAEEEGGGRGDLPGEGPGHRTRAQGQGRPHQVPREPAVQVVFLSVFQFLYTSLFTNTLLYLFIIYIHIYIYIYLSIYLLI